MSVQASDADFRSDYGMEIYMERTPCSLSKHTLYRVIQWLISVIALAFLLLFVTTLENIVQLRGHSKPKPCALNIYVLRRLK